MSEPESTETPSSTPDSTESITTDAQSAHDSEQGQPDGDEKDLFVVKINGKEKKVTRDELIKGYQLEAAAHEKMRKAEKIKADSKPLFELYRALKEGDLDVLKHVGIDEKKLADWSHKELEAYIKKLKKSPEEQETDRIREENERLRQSQQEIINQRAAQQVEADIMGAFKELKTPMKGNATLIRRVAEYMSADIRRGRQPNALTALKRAKESAAQDAIELLKTSSTDENFLDLLPTSFVDEVRKRGLKKVKSQNPAPSNSQGSADQKTKQSPISDEFREYMKRELQKRG